MIEKVLITLAVTAIASALVLLARYSISNLLPRLCPKPMGLQLFLTLREFKRKSILEHLIDGGKPNDEVLVVGRTNRWLIPKMHNRVIQGMRTGLRFHLLMLDPSKAHGKGISLAPLQLDDQKAIWDDLQIAVDHVSQICELAAAEELVGSLEAKVCDSVILNSLTAYTSGERRHLILDFSFGLDEEDKYVQYFICNVADVSHFGNRLYSAYKGYFNKAETYVGYERGKVKPSDQFLKRRIDSLLDEYSDYEPLRKNQASRFLHAIPTVLNSISGGQEPPPISVQIELTNRCNSKCIHCSRHKWPAVVEMQTHRILSLLDELADLGVKSVTFSGGEPTLTTELPQILQHAASRGLRTGILSNGLDISDTLAAAIVNSADWIRISLDGSTPAVQDTIRGVPGALVEVEHSIARLINASLARQCNCVIGISCCIQRHNIGDIIPMMDFVESLGLPHHDNRLSFKFAHGHDGFLCTVQQLEELHKSILTDRTLVDRSVSNLAYLKRFIGNYSSLGQIAGGKPLSEYFAHNAIRCFTPYLFAVVDAVGDVYPCCFLYHDNGDHGNPTRGAYRMGNIIGSSFNEVWRSRRYQDFRDDLARIRVDRHPECSECTRHYLHNSFLTKLSEILSPYVQGGKVGQLVAGILTSYPSDVVWL